MLLYIDDCIECLVKLGINPDNEQIVNISPDEITTINELAAICANETGLNKPPIYYTRGRPQEVLHATCSSARRITGLQTKTSLKEAVKRTADYIRENGVKKFNYHI